MSEPKRNALPAVPEEVPDMTDDKPRQRARTMSRKEMARMFRQQKALGGVDPELQALMAELDATRPKLRGECAEGERPCPYVSCKYNLYVDVNPRTGSVKMNFPDKELWELAETCALDVADRQGITLEEVGVIMNLTRERVRQLEMRGLTKLRVIADDEPKTQAQIDAARALAAQDDDE
jgi:hypothetical protein